jgi:phosphoenolpyruvate---glycerone phosphotransferase subunit DhaL
MTASYAGQVIADAMLRVCAALKTQVDTLTSLDQAVGDGDMGYTLGKIADALAEYARTTPTADLGKFLGGAGMLANKVGPSTMGTLLATALMRAGKVVMGKTELAPADLVAMLQAAEQGMQERGKAQLGDKTILDALHPANKAFAAAIAAGEPVEAAGAQALAAAESGRDAVTPWRSQIGRASWVGERTEGQIDPGCAALVVILAALVG